MNIRRATIDDLEAILAIELENFSPEEAIDETVLAKYIETFPNSFLVAEKDGQLLGYLEGPVTQKRYVDDRSFTMDVRDESHLPGGFITITSLSIAQSAQGLGVGKALLETMKRVALEEGREGISLTCHDYLIEYYERNGFVNEGRSASNYAGEVWYNLVWEVPSSK